MLPILTPRLYRVLKTVVALSLCAAPSLRAVDADDDHVKGPVTVWIVSPATAQEKALLAARNLASARTLPTTVQESTTGDFGRPSSNLGQTAGSYGQTSSTLGGPSSETGQTGGSYGQTAGSLGTASSNVGRTAGSYGQTPGNFGQTAGSYGQLSSSYGEGLSDASLTRGSNTSVSSAAARGDRRDSLERLARSFPLLQVRYVNVSGETLQDSLLAAQGTEAFPDVITGVLPPWWDGSGWGLAMLGSLRFLDVTQAEWNGRLHSVGRAVVLTHSPHPEQARAYVLRLREGELCAKCLRRAKEEDLRTSVGVAVSAVNRVLHGGALGAEADEAAAPFSGALAQQMALIPLSDAALNGLEYEFDVLDAGANDRLAVVSVRAVVSSAVAFGAVQAVVILRKDVRGRWRVLQVSPGVPPALLGVAGQDLLVYTKEVAPEKVAHVVGISQAAPVDGEIRQLRPELWWDNGGGADMQVVEWQRKAGAA